MNCGRPRAGEEAKGPLAKNARAGGHLVEYVYSAKYEHRYEHENSKRAEGTKLARHHLSPAHGAELAPRSMEVRRLGVRRWSSLKLLSTPLRTAACVTVAAVLFPKMEHLEAAALLAVSDCLQRRNRKQRAAHRPSKDTRPAQLLVTGRYRRGARRRGALLAPSCLGTLQRTTSGQRHGRQESPPVSYA